MSHEESRTRSSASKKDESARKIKDDIARTLLTYTTQGKACDRHATKRPAQLRDAPLTELLAAAKSNAQAYEDHLHRLQEFLGADDPGAIEATNKAETDQEAFEELITSLMSLERQRYVYDQLRSLLSQGRQLRIAKSLSTVNHFMAYSEWSKACCTTVNHAEDYSHGTFEGLIDQVSDLQTELAAKTSAEDVSPPLSMYSSGIGPSEASYRQDLKARPIPVPVFKGGLSDWRMFWADFNDYVDRVKGITNRERLIYLRDAMQDPVAQRIVRDSARNGDDYTRLSELLMERFDRPREVFLDALQGVLDIEESDYTRQGVNDLSELLSRYDNIIDCHGDGTAKQLLTAIVELKMTPKLKEQWRLHDDSDSVPSTKKLLAFLNHRGRVLASEPETSTRPKVAFKPPKPAKKVVALPAQSLRQSPEACLKCKGSHPLRQCPEFAKLTVPRRLALVKELKLCTNCLGWGHFKSSCNSRFRCRECSATHHTMLHSEPRPVASLVAPPVPVRESDESEEEVALVARSSKVRKDKPHLPFTAIGIVSANGRRQKSRVQFDTGAMTNLISSRLARTIRATRMKSTTAGITGIGGSETSPCTVEVVLSPENEETRDSMKVLAHVVERIPKTSVPPNFSLAQLDFVTGIQLSDPDYSSDSRVDLLLGSRRSVNCERPGVRYSEDHELKAQNTMLGWTVGGGLSSKADSSFTCLKVSPSNQDLDNLLQRFWEAESLEEEAVQDEADLRVMQHFAETHTRDQDGRYVVALPRKPDAPILGDSRKTAVRRFYQNQRSLMKKGTWSEFDQAVQEYITLGHAERVPSDEAHKPSEQTYYLPMHGVVKESSTTTRLRVVFDASAKSSSGVSLNDQLEPGPSFYPLLSTIVNRFRMQRVGFSADISKMFREIVLHADERDFHRFLVEERGVLIDYRMRRLTFGVTSSPFLATRVLHQLADDHQTEFPAAAALIKGSFYVDDCLSGAESSEAASALITEIINLFRRCGMNIRKWQSSSEDALSDVPVELKEATKTPLEVKPTGHAKALGIHWDKHGDEFHIATPTTFRAGPPTKRSVTSDAARVFDYLGWFSPVIFLSKTFMKRLWLEKIAWDDPLPPSLAEEWLSWRSQLSAISVFSIPRRALPGDGHVIGIQLHGFSDASVAGYGCSVYVRALYSDTSISVTLLTTKTKVAPIKASTIPRLELCGATLLARLLKQTANDLNLPIEHVFAWCDSSAVIGWINSPPTKGRVYEANRVRKLSSLVPAAHWRYVKTGDNPADVASRGMEAKELVKCQLWWKGPSWLSEPPDKWPRRPDINLSRELPDLKPVVLLMTEPKMEFGVKYSRYTNLVRITAWILRWRFKVRGRVEQSDTLSPEELRRAKGTLIRLNQQTFFPEEVKQLTVGKALSNSHPLAKLAPYIEKDGLMRVGGRLSKAEVPQESIHPVILSPQSHLVKIYLRQVHMQAQHAGPSTVMAIVASKFHILRLRAMVRKMSKECVICQKAYAKALKQRMGELPAPRITPSPPFYHTGVDYAGPMAYKRGNVRKPTLLKAYISVFICFATRAVHLEVVTDLRADTFLAAFQRFAARRGLPSCMYSDNGTNFVGANAELKTLQEFLQKAETQYAITNWTASNDISWEFSPSRAPHFGGLWEAAVKAMKGLLRKSVGCHTLTYEELTTVITQAEAAMNSRPLHPLDSLADDGVSALTSGHFLVGRPLLAPPSKQHSNVKIQNLRRWNLVETLTVNLWERWKGEYIQCLQKRNKWLRPGRELAVGDVVLVKDETLFVKSWPLGLVMKCHPGQDGHVRVVDLKVQGKIYRRPIHRLVYLPARKDEEKGISPSREDVQARSQAAAPPTDS